MVPRMSASHKMTDLSLASDVSEPVIEGDDLVLTTPSLFPLPFHLGRSIHRGRALRGCDNLHVGILRSNL